ncbi:MAG: NifB/NifX family molybdenum-iron cluster-binding protein [Desulfuromonadales bacterium]|nr:NifB/NifX family molybdenum-iron cluster-binding protein [Desulfuromonadales bacterium]
MKVCFPVAKDAGLESSIYGHLGSTPHFITIDTGSEEVSCFPNADPLAPEAGCNVLKALCHRSPEAIIVDGIGDGFLQMLKGFGIDVFQAESASVRENLTMFKEKQLSRVEILNSRSAGRCNSDDDTPHTCNHSHDEEDD